MALNDRLGRLGVPGWTMHDHKKRSWFSHCHAKHIGGTTRGIAFPGHLSRLLLSTMLTHIMDQSFQG